MFETLKNFASNALNDKVDSIVDPALAVLSVKLDALAFGLFIIFAGMAFFGSSSGKRYTYWTVVFYIFAKVIIGTL